MPVIVISSSSLLSRACLLHHSQQVDTLAGPLSCRAEGSRHPGLPESAPLVPQAVSILKVGCRAQCADYTRLFHMAGWANEDTGGHCRQCCCAAERSPHRALQVQFPHTLLLMFMLVLCVALDCESSSCHTQSGGAKLNARFTPVLSTWLVGPMTTQEATVDNGVLQQSGVNIERCRCPAHASGTSCSHA